MAGGTLIGVVHSAGKMAKTVMVEVTRNVKHPKYHRILRRSSKHMAHDEAGVLVTGDKVKIERSRPLSKNKHYVVSEKVINVDDVEVFKPLEELYPDLSVRPAPIIRPF
eukprot:TRINITY_DN1834_c0_g1_i1.p1 TRINITY_DN1834_c0_g1~~TRINITY_DN1834_c0_g1_i1.p1  ORF type:complete len:109 (+),score=35.52 TRINITY_DN1834_c0_g1_i1:49-375(+)